MMNSISKFFFKIDEVDVGGSEKCYIIAEMSGNHDGDLNEAKKIIKAAKNSGANAVKLQTYRADTITMDTSMKDFCLPVDNPWETHKTLFDLYEKASTPWEWHYDLFQEAKKNEITIFSSPFDTTAVDFLEELDCPAYKIASPEITDIPLIKKVAQTGKPVIISTGLAELNDIILAVDTLRENNCENFAILQCLTAYPAPIEETNLALLPEMSEKFQCVVGVSDHSIGITVPISSIHYGSKIIEKHFVLNRSDSVDGFFSSDELDFREMVKYIREAEKSIGSSDFSISKSAKNNFFARRSLYVSKDVKAGEMITPNNIKSVRPGFGLHPKYYDIVLGKTFKNSRTRGERLTEDDINDFSIDILNGKP